jgi:hypothetical protein
MPVARSPRDSASPCASPLAGLQLRRYTVGRTSLHRLVSPNIPMCMATVARIALAVVATVVVAGCAVPTETTRVTGGPEPVTLRLEPRAVAPGQSAELMIASPGADSIVFESDNGLDRYSATGDTLRARLDAGFGDSVAVERFATRYQRVLLSRIMKPARIHICRAQVCRTIYHEIPLVVPEANHRTVAVTAGYNTVFARRSLVGSHSVVLFREALSSGIWSAQAELSDRRWSGRVEGYAGSSEGGLSLDLARVLKRAGEVSYGVAVPVDAARSGWLPLDESPVLSDRTGWRVGLGPSVMLRGVTASSQLGIYDDGTQTLQFVSTRISLNGNLTEVRLPVSLTAEKTFAFGGGAIISRRRDALERMVASIHLVDAFAVNVGVASHRSAWPNDRPSDDLRASETLLTLGGQYTLTW